MQMSIHILPRPILIQISPTQYCITTHSPIFYILSFRLLLSLSKFISSFRTVSFNSVFTRTKSKLIPHILRIYEQTISIKFQFGGLELSSIFMRSSISEFSNKLLLHWTITSILGIWQWAWRAEEHIRRKFRIHAAVYEIHTRSQSENNRVLHSHRAAFWSDDSSQSTYSNHKIHVNSRAHQLS